LRQMSASPESMKRQAVWEQQVVKLDQKEAELHRRQVRLMKEQSGSFARDLNSLRREVDALASQQDIVREELQSVLETFGLHPSKKAGAPPSPPGLVERVAFLEQLAGDSAERRAGAGLHGRPGAVQALQASALERMESLEKHLGICHGIAADGGPQSSALERLERLEASLEEIAERQARDLKALKDAQDRRRKELEGLRAAQALQTALQERLQVVEQSLTDLTLAHGKDMHALKMAHSKHDAAHSKYGKDLESLKEVHAQHDSLVEKVAYLEVSVGDAADRHGGKLQSLKSSVDQQAKDVESLKTSAGSLPERLDSLDRRLVDAEGRRVKEMQALKTAYDKQLRDLESRASRALHASSPDRLEQLERLVEEAVAAERHRVGLQTGDLGASGLSGLRGGDAELQGRLQWVEGKLGEVAGVTEAHVRELESLRDAGARRSAELEGLKVLRDKLPERVDNLEMMFGESADKHHDQLRELRALHRSHLEGLAALRAAHGRSASSEHLEALKLAHGQHEAELASVSRALEDTAGRQVEIAARVEWQRRELEGLKGSVSQLATSHAAEATTASDARSRHERQLEDLREAVARHSSVQARHSQDVSALKASQAYHANLKERLCDSAEKHENDLQALRTLHAQHSTMIAQYGQELSSLRAANQLLLFECGQEEQGVGV